MFLPPPHSNFSASATGEDDGSLTYVIPERETSLKWAKNRAIHCPDLDIYWDNNKIINTNEIDL